MHLNRESGKEEPKKGANELLVSTKNKENEKANCSFFVFGCTEKKKRQQIKSYVLTQHKKNVEK